MINLKNPKNILVAIIILVLIGAGVFYIIKTKPWQPKPEEISYEIDFSKIQNMPADSLERLKQNYQTAKEAYATDPNNFNSLMTFAFTYYQLGDYQKARDTYIKVGEISPKNYTSFWDLGNTYIRLQDYANAEQAYLKAIENGPDQARFYRALGELYWYNMQDKKAQIPDLYKKGLETLPGDYDLLVGLAEYYRDTGDKTNATKYYNQIIEKYPDSKEAIEEEIRNL